MGDGVPALATAISVKRALRAREGKRPKATCERAAERDTQPSKRKCNCEASLRHREDLPFADGQDPSLSRTVKEFMDSVWCNFRGHSYLSRFLLYGLGGVVSKKHPEVPKTMYRLLASDLYELFHTGIEVPGRGRVYGAVVALKGDMDWHKKCMNLTRLY
ncbi:unnamed protein product [Symbiodinium sp. KB8]|nr:unnamed protein product [Symbiodinium sp. KB8]